MGIRVRATTVCYHNHKRWKEGEIFEIRNMALFSKLSMKLVDAKAEDEVDKPDEERGGAALSEGTKALHQGSAGQPKNAGAAADVAADAAEKKRRASLTDEERAVEDKEIEEGAKEEKGSEEQGPPKENETDGNEDVI